MFLLLSCALTLLAGAICLTEAVCDRGWPEATFKYFAASLVPLFLFGLFLR